MTTGRIRSHAISLAIALCSSGCFTSWAITQGFGTQRILDEGVREQTVPLAGVEEKLAVSLPLAIEYEYTPATNTSSPQTVAPQNKKELPFALTCSTKQYAQDRVYHSAFRYGWWWKKLSGGMFLAEAALGALLLWADHNREPPEPMQPDGRTGLIVGGFLAIDAVGTLAIFFIPRKEVFTVDDKAVMTPIREDCPDGLVLDIGGTSYPIDAAGRIGEVGEVALDEWMRGGAQSHGSIALTFEGRAMPLRVDARERCAWVFARVEPAGPSASATPSASPGSDDGVERACRTPGFVTMADLPRVTTAVIIVPTGSLSMATAPPATTDSR